MAYPINCPTFRAPFFGALVAFIALLLVSSLSSSAQSPTLGRAMKAQEYLDQVIEDDVDLKFIHHSYVDYMGYLISEKDSDAHMISESQKTP